MNNVFALLCAMSVGAAIVIAKPSETGALTNVTDEPTKGDDKDLYTLLLRLRLQAKGLALRTIELGRELGSRTARIGGALTSLIK